MTVQARWQYEALWDLKEKEPLRSMQRGQLQVTAAREGVKGGTEGETAN